MNKELIIISLIVGTLLVFSVAIIYSDHRQHKDYIESQRAKINQAYEEFIIAVDEYDKYNREAIECWRNGDTFGYENNKIKARRCKTEALILMSKI